MSKLFGGLLNYEKPGAGVDKDEPQKKRIFLYFILLGRKFFKLIQINLLFLVCCIPVVTIGPAFAGFTFVLRNLSWEKPVFIAGDFFDVFKKNFKRAFLFGLLDVAAIFIVGVAVWFYYNLIPAADDLTANGGVFYYILFVISLAVAIMFVFMHFYAYLMLVSTDLGIKNILKNSFLLSVICLRPNIITGLFISLILFGIWLFLPLSMVLVILIVPALLWFTVCFNSFPGILRHVSDPYYAKLKEEQGEQGGEENPEAIFADIGKKEIPVKPDSGVKRRKNTIK
ncbi:MAG: DUF624 domain-containing protein [Oscillospiraceae bacterium]|nr:DUF624 domain-containing protein [Oscillospiraceae bacterium]